MESLHDGLTSWGVSESRIHYEFFGPAKILNKKEASTADSAQAATDRTPNIEVSFARSGVTAIWDGSSESILDLAEAHGLRPDFSCRMGICHTCMCALIRGEVEYACDPIDLPDPGSLLICCAKPRTNIVIDV
jgi:ferredoxin